MAFGSNDFPLGPNGKFPPQRIGSYGNRVAPPNRIEEMYEGLGVDAKLPVTEKNFTSSVERAKSGMKYGKPNKHSDRYEDIDKFRPKYAQRSSLRRYDAKEAIRMRLEASAKVGGNEWLKRRKQRFPGLEAVGPEKIAEMRRIKNELRPATGMSGVGFFGRHGELGDVEQKFTEDYNQSLGFYTRRPYR
jgi:hypothetical protein